MFHLGLRHLLLNVLVTVATQFFRRLAEQLLHLGLMRTVAGEAFSIFYWLMLELGGGRFLFEILMTIEAELAVGLDQHPFVIISVGVMARGALAVLCRLMLEFGWRRLRLVTFPAKRPAGLVQHFGIGRT